MSTATVDLPMPVVATRDPWQVSAACQDGKRTLLLRPQAFDAGAPVEDQQAARAWCVDQCEVRRQCLAAAKARRAPVPSVERSWGVWGGAVFHNGRMTHPPLDEERG